MLPSIVFPSASSPLGRTRRSNWPLFYRITMSCRAPFQPADRPRVLSIRPTTRPTQFPSDHRQDIHRYTLGRWVYAATISLRRTLNRSNMISELGQMMPRGPFNTCFHEAARARTAPVLHIIARYSEPNLNAIAMLHISPRAVARKATAPRGPPPDRPAQPPGSARAASP